MARAPLLQVFLAVALAVAVALIVPMHLALEHHGESAAEHDGDDHGDSDHELVASFGGAPSPLSFPPALAPEPPLDAASIFEPTRALLSREVDLREVPPPDRSARPPTPPRPPPASLA